MMRSHDTDVRGTAVSPIRPCKELSLEKLWNCLREKPEMDHGSWDLLCTWARTHQRNPDLP